MRQSVFDHSDYKAYLRGWIEEKKRGERSRIAALLRCHLAYVSQVLNGSAHFSLEQADALNPHLGHAEDEADFFLLLVQHARAGSASLRDNYARKIRKTLESRIELKSRLRYKQRLPLENQAIYYSSWHYIAAHLLVSVPGFQAKEAIARRLRLPVSRVNEILGFLETIGLVSVSGDGYRAGEVSVFLGSDSPMVAKHHTNWRMQAIQSLDRPAPGELHYSSTVSISRRDAPAIREILSKAIEEVRAVVRGSAEEELYCYCLDLFEV